MKILVVQESDWLERGVHQQHHLMERLSLRGHEVRAIDFEIRWSRKPRRKMYSKRKVFKGVSKATKGSSVAVIRPGVLKFPLLDYTSIALTHSMEIRRQIVEFKPDVIIGLGILNTFVAMRLAKRLDIPFVYYLIDALHTLIPVKKLRFLGKVLESDTLKRCDVVCVINEELKRYAIEMGAQPKKVHVVKAGIDTERFNPDVNGHTMREKLGISRDDVVLFFMGWLYSFSGLKEVALTLAKVRDEYPDIRLLIVGQGDLYHELQQIKKDLSLQQLVLAGWQPYEKIPEYIAASNICLLPAHYNEVMRNIVPIKMYEYMACGKPVISTRLPGITREFGHNNGVIYVDQPTEVIEKVIKITEDGEGVIECGAKAKRFVEKHSWQRITDDFEDVLNNYTTVRSIDAKKIFWNQKSKRVLPQWAKVKNGRFSFLRNKVLEFFYYDRYHFLLSLTAKDLNNHELNPQNEALDIGCGVGNLLSLLSGTRGFVTTGIDSNKASLKKIPPKHKIINAYVPPLPFLDSTFDLVIALGLTEHIPDEEVFVKEVVRVLKDNGIYICTMPIEIGVSGLVRHIVKNFVYPNRQDCKSIFDYSINELRGECPRKMHGTGHKYYNYKYLLKTLSSLFSVVNVYYWPRFFPKIFAPVIFARCIK